MKRTRSDHGLMLDSAGMESVYRTYGALVSRMVAWKLAGLPREEVDEVVCSLWARLLEADCARLKSFGGRNGAGLGTWLCAVARNAALDYLRRRNGQLVSLDAPGEDGKRALSEYIVDCSPDPLEAMVARETRREVILRVRALPWIYRQVIFARFYRDSAAARASELFGIEEPTVYVRLSRAFVRLRKMLAVAVGR